MSSFGYTSSVTVEILEIYNEEVYDLLSTSKNSGKSSTRPALEVRHEKNGSTVVTNLTIVPVTSPKDVFALLDTALKSRSTGSTNCNVQSSRSHSVFTMKIHLEHQATAVTKSGVLHVVDLAGSERLAKSGAAETGGALLKETQNINKSLATLTQVFSKFFLFLYK
jgi:kinesin family member C1